MSYVAHMEQQITLKNVKCPNGNLIVPNGTPALLVGELQGCPQVRVMEGSRAGETLVVRKSNIGGAK